MQTVLGRSEVETGLLLTPWPLATMVMAPLAGYLIERVHAGLLGALGMAVMACGLFSLVLLPASPSDFNIIWPMILCGAGLACSSHRIITPSSPPHRVIVAEARAVCLNGVYWARVPGPHWLR